MKKLTKTALPLLAVAIATFGASVTGAAAAEMRVRNCTNDEILIRMYNVGDVVRAVAREEATYGPGSRYRFDSAESGKKYGFVVYRTGAPDQHMLTTNNHPITNWRIENSAGTWSFKKGDNCK